MKRSAALIFAILLFKLNLQAQVVAYDFSSLYQSTSPAVVQVTTDDGAASGFVVTFEIRPNAGPVPRGKLSSLVSRMTLGKVGRNRDVEFKAEFADFRLYRDGQLMQPVTPGRQLVQGKSEQDGEGGRFLDEAFAGSYVYSPHDFMTGNECKIQIIDARRPNDIYKEIMLSADSAMIRQIRSDFSYSPNFVFTKLP